jgi:hypothetical protein
LRLRCCPRRSLVAQKCSFFLLEHSWHPRWPRLARWLIHSLISSRFPRDAQTTAQPPRIACQSKPHPVARHCFCVKRTSSNAAVSCRPRAPTTLLASPSDPLAPSPAPQTDCRALMSLNFPLPVEPHPKTAPKKRLLSTPVNVRNGHRSQHHLRRHQPG